MGGIPPGEKVILKYSGLLSGKLIITDKAVYSKRGYPWKSMVFLILLFVLGPLLIAFIAFFVPSMRMFFFLLADYNTIIVDKHPEILFSMPLLILILGYLYVLILPLKRYDFNEISLMYCDEKYTPGYTVRDRYPERTRRVPPSTKGKVGIILSNQENIELLSYEVGGRGGLRGMIRDAIEQLPPGRLNFLPYDPGKAAVAGIPVKPAESGFSGKAAVAGILSFIIPGLGQAVARRLLRGLGFFLGAVAWNLIVYIVAPNFATLLGPIYNIFAAYDAYRVFKMRKIEGLEEIARTSEGTYR
jgi:hypothetical protein